ncbi:hypothetical protein DPEC_G00242640 [Dallia pectoralis]|uniref:Uncharacterized protein n=1 Tax=Dallia pectoralis TaxID=75939 RepID=A0ACC2FV23_DALPE|nr:hypothetical protein DPEC_G00242640 [Dallia pectoralis]
MSRASDEQKGAVRHEPLKRHGAVIRRENRFKATQSVSALRPACHSDPPRRPSRENTLIEPNYAATRGTGSSPAFVCHRRATPP